MVGENVPRVYWMRGVFVFSNSFLISYKSITDESKKIGASFVLIVKDQGIGISKESLPYVFEQFFTEDKARSNGNSQGVGFMP